MAASRVVRVTSADDGTAAHELRDGIARIQEELAVTPEFSAEVVAAAEAASANPRLPDLDRTDLPMVTIDPPTLARPRPGDAPRAGRRRVRRLLRHRRRRGVHLARRPDRPRGQQARDDAVRRGLEDPAAPDVALRGRRVAAARPGVPGPPLDDQGRRDRRGHRRARRAGAGPLPLEARLRRRPAGDRRRLRRRAADAAQGGRRAPARARGRARRGLAAAARAGGRDRGRPVGPRVPRPDPRPSSGTRRSRCSPAWPRRR